MKFLFKTGTMLPPLMLCLPACVFPQLVWQGDRLAIIREAAGPRDAMANFNSTWPRPLHEMCPDLSGADKEEHSELSEICGKKQKVPFINFTVNLASHALNRRYPLGDSLDDFGTGTNDFLALKVTSEQGTAWEELPPLVQGEFQYRFSRTAYAYFRMNMARALDAWHDDSPGFNVPLGQKELDINEPSLGYFTWSPSLLTLILGRFPVHWSPGMGYGIALSSSVPYHDGVMLSFKMRFLRFHFLFSSFNPWLSGTPGSFGEDYPVGSEEYRQRHPEYTTGSIRDYNSRNRVYDEPARTLFAHRLEAGFKYLELGVTETIMIGGKSPSLRDGNPFIIFHNNYGDGYVNSGVSLDARVRLPLGLALVGELFLDEIKEADDGGSPTTMGWMTGVQHSLKRGGLVLKHGLHLVRSDPFLYNHVLPYLTLYSRHVVKSNYIELDDRPFIDTYVIDYPLGYVRGPDAFDLWYDAYVYYGSRISGRLNAGLLRQGEKDAFSLFEKSREESPSGRAEKEGRVSLSGTYNVRQNLCATLGYGFQIIKDLHHRRDNDTFRHQVFGGISWSWR